MHIFGARFLRMKSLCVLGVAFELAEFMQLQNMWLLTAALRGESVAGKFDI